MAKKRFVKVHSESIGFSEHITIIVDTETGVHYLMTQQGYAGGLTPLLKSDGTPVISRVYDYEDEK